MDQKQLTSLSRNHNNTQCSTVVYYSFICIYNIQYGIVKNVLHITGNETRILRQLPPTAENGWELAFLESLDWIVAAHTAAISPRNNFCRSKSNCARHPDACIPIFSQGAPRAVSAKQSQEYKKHSLKYQLISCYLVQ